MRIMVYKIITAVTALAAGLMMLCSTAVTAGADDNYCDIAKDIAVKASAAYSKDSKQGLKLFLKAYDLCKSKTMAYNLGIAFYKYGNTREAEKYLEKSISLSETDPVRLNNLASVMLENGHKPLKALELAQKALKYSPDYLPALDTLAKAQFASGKRLEALKTIETAVRKHPAEERVS